MSIGRQLMDVPMGDMIRQMAFAIADGQYQLDENSINVAEMMGGLTAVYDENGDMTFDDSRVFFGYEYMTITEALAYAVIDDAMTGTLDSQEAINMTEAVTKIMEEVHNLVKDDDGKIVKVGGTNETDPQGRKYSDHRAYEIRVPTRLSMLELGFTPTFYQFVDTIIECKIAIKTTFESSYSRTSSTKNASNSSSSSRSRGWWRSNTASNYNGSVRTTQVDATYSSKYSYSAEGASILRTKIVPVPPPTVLEDRIRSYMEVEEERRRAALESRNSTP